MLTEVSSQENGKLYSIERLLIKIKQKPKSIITTKPMTPKLEDDYHLLLST